MDVRNYEIKIQTESDNETRDVDDANFEEQIATMNLCDNWNWKHGPYRQTTVRHNLLIINN